MLSFVRLVAIIALAAISSATAIAERAAHPHLCPGGKIEKVSSIDVGDGDAVTVTTYACDHKAKPRAELERRTTNVCNAACTISCNSITGILPPTSQDCAKISAAIQIFQSVTTTFTVASNHQMALTFGTCSYFFVNTGTVTLQSCYSGLNNTAIADGAACFPPVQPFFPEGLCTSPDGSWSIGASHS